MEKHLKEPLHISGLTTEKINLVSRYFIKKPFVMIGLFLSFLLLRNWRVFLLTDVYDGYIAKINLVAGGFNFENIKHYIKHVALKEYDQHFIPVWFALFFCLVYIVDSNPRVLGFLSFGFGACLLYLLFRITGYFYGKKVNGNIFSLAVALLFSSSLFFLETIAWKWQLGLLISSVTYLFCIVIILERKDSIIWRIIYSAALFTSIWTFGTSWLGAWGIVVFLLLRERNLKHNYLKLTIAIAVVGTLSQIIANTSSIHNINIVYFLANLPALLTLETANIFMLLSGVFRFTGTSQIYASDVLGVTVIAAVALRYGRMYISRRLTEKDAMVVSLLLVYVLLIALSLLRIMPKSGITPNISLEGYIFGNRYLFIYSIPLFIAVVIGCGEYFIRLSKPVIYTFMIGIVALGIVTEIAYPGFDSFTTNESRNKFYNLTLDAVKDASSKKLVLPDLSGELFFQGPKTPLKLDHAVYIRDESYNYKLRFQDPATMTSQECKELHSDSLITTWLNLYNQSWCK